MRLKLVWVFYISVLGPTGAEIAREPFIETPHREQCEFWQDWWEETNGWLADHGVVAGGCKVERRKVWKR